MARTLPTSSAAHCGVYPPPLGVTANCSNPETQTASNIALYTIMVFLAVISVTIRIYTRYFILKSIGLDDCKYFTLEHTYVVLATDLMITRLICLWICMLMPKRLL
jgi:hypothetical protein